MEFLGVLVFVLIFGLPVVFIIRGIAKKAKNASMPVETKSCKVISKRMKVSSSGDSTSTYYYLTLEFDDNSRKEFEIKGKLYGLVKERDRVNATIQGKVIKAIEVDSKGGGRNKFCEHCGSMIEPGAVSCSACGARIMKNK